MQNLGISSGNQLAPDARLGNDDTHANRSSTTVDRDLYIMAFIGMCATLCGQRSGDQSPRIIAVERGTDLELVINDELRHELCLQTTESVFAPSADSRGLTKPNM